MGDGFRLALHSWTTDTTPLAGVLDAARLAGFDAVELRRLDFVRCFEQGLSREAVVEIIRSGGMPLGILGTEYGWFFAEGEEQRRLFDVLRETCAIAKSLGCDMLMSAPGQLMGTVGQAIAATRIAGEIVGEYGLRLALEFNSQHPLVNNTNVLREIIDGAGHANCGLLLDAYHLHRGPGVAKGLEGVRGEEIFVFQYSDVPPVPEAGVRRPVDRLPPGDGVVDWDELFGLLRAMDYRGFLSYEAPNPVLWQRPAAEVAAEGVARTRSLLANGKAYATDHTTQGAQAMSNVTLAEADKIIGAALAKARENSFEPLTVVVLDAGGHVVAAKREDDSGILRYEIAFGKAYGALGFGLGSRTLAGRAAKVPAFFTAVSAAADGRIVPAAGGVLIRNAQRRVIGAVGISGDTGDNDEIAAVTGISATGLNADPGA